MGLFSSKYEYFAYAGSSSVFEEDERPDTDKQEILEAAIGDGSIAKSIPYSIGIDWFARSRAMMKYAIKPIEDGGYVRGFPTARFVKLVVPDDAIIDAIERDTGERPEELLQNDYGGYFQESFFINHELQKYWLPQGDGDLNDDMFEWDPNQPPDKDIWCETFDTIQIPVKDSTGAYITAPNPYSDFLRGGENIRIWDPQEPGLDPNPEQPLPGPGDPLPPGAGIPTFLNYIYEVSWNYTDPDTGTDEVFTVEMNLLKFAQELGDRVYLRVVYLLPGSDCPRYWTYLVGSGEDPILESKLLKIERDSQFLPVAILMQDKVWYDEDPTSDLAITTNKLLKKLNLRGDEIKEDFIEQEEDPENEDNGAEKWDFFIHFAVPIRTTVPGSKQYLFNFFEDMQGFSRWDRAKYQEYLDKQPTQDPDSLFSMVQPTDELVIQEGFENGYYVEYAWSYIDLQEFEGEQLVDDEGRDWKRRQTEIEILERNADEARYAEIIELMHGPDATLGPITDDPERDGYHDFVFFTRQEKTPEGDPYVRRMLVMGLSMAYKINTSTEAGEGYRFRYAIPELFGTEEETKEFRIPVSFPAVKRVSVLKREDVITDALVATVFLVREEKIKWYQSGFFKWLIVIIAVILIVLAIFNPGFLGVAASFLTGGATAGTAFVLVYSLLSFAVGFIISFAGSLIGGTAGQIFALIGMIAMMYGGGAVAGQNGFTSSWGNLTSNPSWGSAFQFISMTTSIANATLKVYAAYQLEELQAEMEDFVSTAKEKQEALEEAWAQLGDGPNWLDPLSLSQTLSYPPVEYPRTFFARTLNLNPGLLGYDLVNNFPEMALNLPDNPGDANIVEAQYETFAKQRGAA